MGAFEANKHSKNTSVSRGRPKLAEKARHREADSQTDLWQKLTQECLLWKRGSLACLAVDHLDSIRASTAADPGKEKQHTSVCVTSVSVSGLDSTRVSMAADAGKKEQHTAVYVTSVTVSRLDSTNTLTADPGKRVTCFSTCHCQC